MREERAEGREEEGVGQRWITHHSVPRVLIQDRARLGNETIGITEQSAIRMADGFI